VGAGIRSSTLPGSPERSVRQRRNLLGNRLAVESSYHKELIEQGYAVTLAMPIALRQRGEAIGKQSEIKLGLPAGVTQCVSDDRQVCSILDEVPDRAFRRCHGQPVAERDILRWQLASTVVKIGALRLTTDRGGQLRSIRTKVANVMKPRGRLPRDYDASGTVTEAIACQSRGITTEPRCSHIEVGATGRASIFVHAVCEPDKIAGLGEA